MSGRPPRGNAQAQQELAELARWLKAAVAEAGFSSLNELVVRKALDKNAVYGMAGGTRLLPLEATKLIALSLRRDPAEVEVLWNRAKESRDRKAMAAGAADQPRLTSWAQRPLPTPALRELLEAQQAFVEELPYRELGVQPPTLPTIYVQQRVRQQPSSRGSVERISSAGRESDGSSAPGTAKPDTESKTETLPVSEMLNRNSHILVDGEPGGGKSTLSYHLVHRLSRIWLHLESAEDPPLEEPVLPIRVPATALCARGTWSGVLADALRKTLGIYLVTDPESRIFQERMHGARWLVIVDGLDEITNRQDRVGVVQAIARHAKAAGPYRFIVTTRPLPEVELAALRGSQFETFSVQPFGREQLRRFADCWFRAQDRHRSADRASDFLRQIEDGRLTELVSNPLLATIAAIAQTLEPDRPLPASRVALYQRFYDYLMDTDRRANYLGPAVGAAENGAATDFQHWLAQHRDEMTRVLARARLDGTVSLLASAEQ